MDISLKISHCSGKLGFYFLFLSCFYLLFFFIYFSTEVFYVANTMHSMQQA